jgi:hypothetical protein
MKSKPPCCDVPVLIEWDAVADADRYGVIVKPEGADCRESETTDPRIIVRIPTNRMTLVYVTSMRGQLVSLSPAQMQVYVSRW